MKAEINQELVRELLHYDPETGVFTWRSRDRKHFNTDSGYKIWHARYPGKVAGTVRRFPNGYSCIQIKLFGTLYGASRLAWLYMLGDQIPRVLDHINRDATDNRWENIRASSYQENALNLSISKRNKSGVVGVCWNKARRKWRAHCNLRGEQMYLGSFAVKQDAINALIEFRKKHGYTEGHGEARPEPRVI